MSDEGRAFVINSSPYTGVTYLIHYMLGDLENATHHHELWIGPKELAFRSGRCSIKTLARARAQMVEDGFLEQLTDHTAPGVSMRYRFLFPTVDKLSSDSEHRTSAEATPPTMSSEHRTSAEAHCSLTEVEPKENRSVAVIDEIDMLCLGLADAIEQHRGGIRRPKIETNWHLDMDRLIRLGPLGREKPEEIGIERVRNCIRVVFTAMNTPVNGFCWADQVQSPAALRRHWDKIYDAALKLRQKSTDPLDRIGASI